MNGVNFRYGKYMNGSCFSLGLVYEWGGVRGLQPHIRTQNHGKLPPPPRGNVFGYFCCSFWLHSLVTCENEVPRKFGIQNPCIFIFSPMFVFNKDHLFLTQNVLIINNFNSWDFRCGNIYLLKYLSNISKQHHWALVSVHFSGQKFCQNLFVGWYLRGGWLKR